MVMGSRLQRIRLRPAMVTALAVAASCVTRSAHTQSVDDARSRADVLFREGQQLLTGGQVVTACDKLEESERLDPKLGRLLNVAYCHEQLGRTATAWGEYNEAAALALQTGQAERQTFARNQAGELARRLSFIQIDVAEAPDLSQVTVDGRELARDQWSLPLPADSGSHTLTFAAAGHKARSQVVTLTAPGTVRVAAGPLQIEVPPPSPAPPSAPTPAPGPVPVRSRSADSGRAIGWSVGAAGGAALGAGIGFGLRAMLLKSDADPMCPNRVCTAEGASLIADAKTAATVSTVGLVAGAIGVGVGAWLVLRTPSTSARAAVAPYVAADRAGVALHGIW
jgi:hypothetical protein